jgi:hypothetical protein
MHFAGSKHKKKLEMAGLSTDLTDYVERPKNLDIWSCIVRCLLCKVIMLGAECLIHGKSAEHERKLSKMSQRNKDFYSEVDNCFKVVEKDRKGADEEDLSCGLCEVELSGKDHLELHLKGKKHLKRCHWLRIGSKESNAREYKQVWCSLCKVFVNNLEGFEGHIRGRQHIKRLKKEGVKWRVLVDSYGEESVGADTQRLSREAIRDSDRTSERREHRAYHPSCHDGGRSSRLNSSGEHSPSTSSSPSQLPTLPAPSWKSKYALLPEYDSRLPKVLREGKPCTERRSIIQRPLLAVGAYVDRMNEYDPRLSEMEQASQLATQEREAKEREERRGCGYMYRERSWTRSRDDRKRPRSGYGGRDTDRYGERRGERRESRYSRGERPY